MTKEEIREVAQNKNWGGYVSSHVIWLEAMDIFAKQESIEFDRWWFQEGYFPAFDGSDFYYEHRSLSNETPESLYTIYQNSKK